MPKRCHPGKAMCRKWGEIHLVDKCLLIILTILMIQSALNLFVHESMNLETNSIDVVVRTSAAGIFGYLISTNFNQSKKRAAANAMAAAGAGKASAAPVTAPPPAPDAPRNQIGFVTTAPVPVPGGTHGMAEFSGNRSGVDRTQIVIVAAIGIVSLLIMLVFRDLCAPTAANDSSLTQFRDFVSGSVGFLISCSTSHTGSRLAA